MNLIMLVEQSLLVIKLFISSMLTINLVFVIADFFSEEFVNFTFSSGTSLSSPSQYEIHVVDDDVVEDDSENILIRILRPFITVPEGSNTFNIVNQISGNISIQDNDGKI